ncbi:MAG: membrane lipoprotein lipid attachment site-containing protein [Spirochaetaceae bacterium]|nr:membrane lipoprotein lipid attachment site-containing protein [Spirochaetaceae bacterium]
MKKNILFTLVLVFMLTACQSTKVPAPEVEPELYPLDFSANGGKTLDGYWESYFETKDTFYLDNILAYVKAEDALLANLNVAYKENKIDDSWVYYLDLTKTDGVLTSNYDMDALSVLLLQYGDKEVSNDMKFLYSLFPQDLLIRNAVKSSAYWSLASNAEQIASVRLYLEEKLSELSVDKRNFFSQFYGIAPSIENN